MTTTHQSSMQAPSGEKSSQSKNEISAMALAKAVTYMLNDLGWSRAEYAKILHLKARTVNSWLQDGKIPIDRLAPSPEIQAIIHSIAIHRSLSAMFEDSNLKKEWMNTKHPDFKISPKEVMAQSIDGLVDVRRYLDYVRGRGA